MDQKYYKFIIFSVFLLIVILPIFYLFNSIFSIKLLYDPSAFSSLTNYLSFFYDSRLNIIFLRTLLLAFGTAVLAIIIGTTLAFLFECTNLPHKLFFKITSLLPLLIPPYISAIAWMEFLGARGDLININLPFGIYNIQTAIIILALSLYPIVTLITSFAIKNIDRKLEEAGRLIYSEKKVLSKITLPLVKPHILVAGFFVFILALSEYGVPNLLRVNTFPNEIFAQFSAFFNLEGAIILSLPLVIVATLLILFYNFYLKNKSFVTLSSFSTKRKNYLTLSKIQKNLALIYIISIIILSLIIPLSVLLIESKFMFLEAFLMAYDSIFNSIWLGILGATLMTLFGFFLAYFSKDSKYLDVLILLPVAIPGTVIGISLINFWNISSTNLIYASFWIIIIGYFIRFLPFVVKTLSPFLSQISPSIEESARLTGVSFYKIINKIFFPLTKQGVIAAFIIGFIFSLRELETTLLVTPPGFQTLPNRIETLMHYGNSEMVSSLSVILILIVLIPIMIIIFSRKDIISKL
jgi:iron(III) transport system permease protein